VTGEEGTAKIKDKSKKIKIKTKEQGRVEYIILRR
jgi:hypothetical protein